MSKKAYILYRYNEFKNDFQYITEYYNTKDIKNDLEISNYRDYTYKSISKLKTKEDIKHLLKGKYIIVKESI